MAQGHLIPYLALALEIEKKLGYTVTFVNTPLNIQKLRPSLPPNTSIRLIELPYSSSDHNLPPNSENTDVLPYPLIIRLIESSLSLKPSFISLIQSLTHPPLCIIADMFFGWTVDIARDLGIFHSIFLSGGAYGFAIYYSIWLNQPQLKTDSDEFSLPDFSQISRIHRSQLANNAVQATGTDSWSVFFKTELALTLKSDGFLINTVEDLDFIGLNYFRRKTGKPVWAIGPVNYSLTYKARSNKEAGLSPDLCIEWLDNHQEDSVLYISFGSQNTISSSQLMELAIGLEKSGKNFIWVIRPPIGFDINGEIRSEWLPEGFEERMREKNRGLLVRKWAPQLEILSHKSTSVFLSHCGWNSILESLSLGVPIIGWPIAADQFNNVKLLEEEIRVCVEVARGNRSEIKHEDVVRVIDLVMNNKKGKGEEMKKKACEVREMIKDAIKEDDEAGFKGSSVKAMEEFFNMALLMRKKTKLDYQ
ncbi:UDP-glucuronosyl/UDP-glucosyltransferase [Macleaya cordata]|uniref:Glycosyltransferase n=1 Tax=Macleaya cordata TaxID=56857 RepID=A0A200Q2X7_MACCD|nr:UDP-glucuronosyl/UDP-glucosyltransferase [Macleaya cordata]